MSDNCTDAVPVLIRRATFCSAFAADARDFRSYNSWVRLRAHPGSALINMAAHVQSWLHAAQCYPNHLSLRSTGCPRRKPPLHVHLLIRAPMVR